MPDFLTIIKDVGFPIAVAVCLFIFLQNEQKQHREESEKLNATITDLKIAFNEAIHSQETHFTEAVNNNTLVMQRLLDKMEEQK